MPWDREHFKCNCDAIVAGSYTQLHRFCELGGDPLGSLKDYSLLILKNGKIVRHSSWYQEDQLTAYPEADQDRAKSEEMYEEYMMRDYKPMRKEQ